MTAALWESCVFLAGALMSSSFCILSTRVLSSHPCISSHSCPASPTLAWLFCLFGGIINPFAYSGVSRALSSPSSSFLPPCTVDSIQNRVRT
ncbi:hypothetical protein L227DRAFT_574897 [Lentinus tigrinus ALCF2SS1-6]|uniref:Uncharacterized protein n=1 Tax=Lentinus tigrinus ALCF2SS1-6 TaxID=1328759 RepID=A0A5C2SA63_9APHY|nr:hypothetical protein L227DRAFT_574897 [Lentinus tigrinus ALCF2SS1-6]